MKTYEYILCSAIWYKKLIPIKSHHCKPKNIDRGIVLCGWRHGDIIGQMCELKGLRTTYFGEQACGYNRQGFLTNKNRFVLRKQAAWIAFKAGQISEKKSTLYSEDLY